MGSKGRGWLQPPRMECARLEASRMVAERLGPWDEPPRMESGSSQDGGREAGASQDGAC